MEFYIILGSLNIIGLYALYNLYMKFENEKKSFTKSINKIYNNIESSRKLNDNYLKNEMIEIDKLNEKFNIINMNNDEYKLSKEKITEMSSKINRLESEIEYLKYQNFNLNDNIEYLSKCNIKEMIKLLEDNNFNEKMEKLEMFQNDTLSKMLNLKKEVYKYGEDKFNNLNTRINQLFVDSQVMNEKITCVSDLINLNEKSHQKNLTRVMGKFNNKFSQIFSRIKFVENDINQYLDKTYMLVGFNPQTGMPIYVVRTNEFNEPHVRQEVVEYWQSQSS